METHIEINPNIYIPIRLVTFQDFINAWLEDTLYTKLLFCLLP